MTIILTYQYQAQINSILRAIDAQTLALKTSLQQTEHRIMSALDDAKAARDNEIAKVEALLAAFAAIKAQLADLQAAGGATPADLQALTDTLNAESAKIDAAMAPPPAP